MNFMKKILLFLISMVVLNAQAQNKFALGIKLGQNFSSVNNVNVDHNAASFHLGASAQIGVGPSFSIAPEVILTQTKLESNPSVLELMGNSALKPETYHLNYLAIPVLAQYKVFKSFIVQAGPQYSILLDQQKDGKETARLAFNSGEFAIVGGAKLDLGGFFLYGRYVIAMNNIRSASELSNNLGDQSTWKTRQWQLGVGFSILNY
ncbi:MAG: PorT family protein [Sediminibacterium sp.]|nr:MAG: PorT family protein [Sediminibacterium sp.]